MATAIPQLDVYYIEFIDKDKAVEIDESFSKEPVVAGANVMAWLASLLLRNSLRPFGLVNFALNYGVSLTPDIVRSLKRLVSDSKFKIIKSPEELQQFENGNGNEWVVNRKTIKPKQYYIRHPKKLNRNVLVEARNFYDYIEEEQRDELIDYIFSHCSAKCIQIDRVEVISGSGKLKGQTKGAEVCGGLNYDKAKSNYYAINDPNGFPHTEPRDNYFWIDKSIMRSIAALGKGASMTQSYECDFTFGLTVGEAKTIGLDISKHKKYSYLIHIEC